MTNTPENLKQLAARLLADPYNLIGATAHERDIAIVLRAVAEGRLAHEIGDQLVLILDARIPK